MGSCAGCASIPIYTPSLTQAISGVLVGLVSLLGYLAVPAYALATMATGFSTSFIVLTKHKDDQDLIKRKDADERAEAEAAEAEEEVENNSVTSETDTSDDSDEATSKPE